jgi:hypothetical protein
MVEFVCEAGGGEGREGLGDVGVLDGVVVDVEA